MILVAWLMLMVCIYGLTLGNYQTRGLRIAMAMMAVFVFNGLYAMVAHLSGFRLTNASYLLMVLLSMAALFALNRYPTSPAAESSLPQARTGAGEWLALPMLLLGGLVLFYFQNKLGRDLTYLSVDPAGHFDMSWTFSKNRLLIIDRQSELLDYSKYPYPILYYVNAGLGLAGMGLANMADLIHMFNLFNWVVYMLIGLEVYYILRIIRLQTIEISVVAFLLIMLGFPLNVLITGFASQLFAVMFFMMLVVSVLVEDDSTSARPVPHVFLQNLGLAGVALTYHYFLPEMLLGLILHHGIKTGTSFTPHSLLRLVQLLFRKYYYALLMVAPMLPNMMGGLPVIKADGGITKDLFSSFLFFAPGLVLLPAIARKTRLNVINCMLMAALMFSLVLYVMCYYRMASPYYFYKNYVLIYMLMGLNAVACIQSGILKTKAYRLLLDFLIILACLGVLYNPHSQVLATDNNFIFNVNKRELGYPRYSAAQMHLITEFAAINSNKDSTCVVDANPGNLIWFWEITNGIHYRGPLKANYPWNSQAWDQLSMDAECRLPNYKYVFDYKCARPELVVVKEAAGSCIYDTGLKP